MSAAKPAPLAGTNVVVFAGLGPVPYAAMLLADLGCTVTLIERTTTAPSSMPPEVDPRRRGQRSVALDLRSEPGKQIAQRLVAAADVLLEGMRPGVMERLGLDPASCVDLNPRLVYVRLTGWGQDGPYAQMAGHDINYIGLIGALHAMGEPATSPPVPLNLLGDYAGGSTFAVIGILAALLERARSGQGQVIDVSIVDGVNSLSTATIGMRNAGLWHGRGQNAFDGSKPWYRTYDTSDGQYVAVGAIEPQFFRALLDGLGMEPAQWPRGNKEDDARLGDELARVFASRPRSYWIEKFESTDACVTPVLTFAEASEHEHLAQRGLFVGPPSAREPAAVPRFSRTPAAAGATPPTAGADTDNVLAALGYEPDEVARLRAEGAVR